MIPNFEAMKYRAGLMRSASCPMYFVMCLKSALECDISNHYFDKTGEHTIHGCGQRRALEG